MIQTIIQEMICRSSRSEHIKGNLMLQIGLIKEKESVVTENMSAVSMHSGGLRVLATPCMIALMEETALECAAPELDDGYGSVGTSVSIHHIAPTPVGMKVHVRARLTAIKGRKLTFELEAFDEKEKIGYGTHERCVIHNERFQKKCDEKQNG